MTKLLSYGVMSQLGDGELAAHIIRESDYMNIATSSPDGDPWISQVYFAYDIRDELVFYWQSMIDSLHSRLIRVNAGRVALSFYDQTVPPNQGIAKGVYMKGVASELLLPADVERGAVILGKRAYGWFDTPTPGLHNGDSPFRLYRARVRQAWVTGCKERRQETKDVRRVVPIDEIRDALQQGDYD